MAGTYAQINYGCLWNTVVTKQNISVTWDKTQLAFICSNDSTRKMRGICSKLTKKKTPELSPWNHPNSNSKLKGAKRLYFMQYSCVVIIFSIWVYTSLYFLPVLFKIWFIVFLCSVFFTCSVLNSMSSLKTYNICLKKNFMTQFYGCGSTVSKQQSSYEETFYF